MSISPSNPSQDGNNRVQHDDMNDAGHEKEANKGIEGGSINEEDSEEGKRDEKENGGDQDDK